MGDGGAVPIRAAHTPVTRITLPQDGQRGPGGGWHCDTPYNLQYFAEWRAANGDPEFPPPRRPLGMQCNVCLDPFTEANGATLYVPNSFATRRPPPPEWNPGAPIAQARVMRSVQTWSHRVASNLHRRTSHFRPFAFQTLVGNTCSKTFETPHSVVTRLVTTERGVGCLGADLPETDSTQGRGAPFFPLRPPEARQMIAPAGSMCADADALRR